MAGKTITQFLVDGSPTGIKTIELSGWIGKAIQIPRSKLKDAKDRLEVNQPAIYFLFGGDENGNSRAYIGEAENLMNRLISHDTSKDFWDQVIAFISKGNDLAKGDIKFLESKAIERAKKIARYTLENTITPVQNTLPEYQIASNLEFLENIDLLISAIGFPIIKEIEHKSGGKNDIIYQLNARGSNAQGMYIDEGFMVLAGSKGLKELQPNVIQHNFYAHRNRPKLIEQGILEYQGEYVVFLKDYIFTSPSGASDTVTGASTNGWTIWKTNEGRTLHEIERKTLK